MPKKTRLRLQGQLRAAGALLVFYGTLALRRVPRRLVNTLTAHTSSRVPNHAAGGVQYFTEKARASRMRALEGGRDVLKCAGYDRTCGVYSPGRSRWRGVSAWAVLRDDVSPRWRKTRYFLSKSRVPVSFARPDCRGTRDGNLTASAGLTDIDGHDSAPECS
jgi:hypothetical protein